MCCLWELMLELTANSEAVKLRCLKVCLRWWLCRTPLAGMVCLLLLLKLSCARSFPRKGGRVVRLDGRLVSWVLLLNA
ncbi:MAG: hypothetical protein ACKESB_01625 [Candidatus Hodgkinia cicadicola]